MNIPKYIELYRRDLLLKNYAESSIENYISQVTNFLYKHEGLFSEPAKINESAIKDWLLLATSINGRKHRISAIKLFYKLTVKQPLKFKYIEYPKSEKKLPQIINQQFLIDKITSIQNLKHRCILALGYCCGLRVSETCNLKITDIDGVRKLIYARQAKGNKDRYVPVSENVLHWLRLYYSKFKPQDYLFNGQLKSRYTERSCQELIKTYLGKEFSYHKLRHSYATTLLETGTDISLIQKCLGHSNIKTTLIYTHVSNVMLNKIQLPI